MLGFLILFTLRARGSPSNFLASTVEAEGAGVSGLGKAAAAGFKHGLGLSRSYFCGPQGVYSVFLG